MKLYKLTARSSNLAATLSKTQNHDSNLLFNMQEGGAHVDLYA